MEYKRRPAYIFRLVVYKKAITVFPNCLRRRLGRATFSSSHFFRQQAEGIVAKNKKLVDINIQLLAELRTASNQIMSLQKQLLVYLTIDRQNYTQRLHQLQGHMKTAHEEAQRVYSNALIHLSKEVDEIHNMAIPSSSASSDKAFSFSLPSSTGSSSTSGVCFEDEEHKINKQTKNKFQLSDREREVARKMSYERIDQEYKANIGDLTRVSESTEDTSTLHQANDPFPDQSKEEVPEEFGTPSQASTARKGGRSRAPADKGGYPTPSIYNFEPVEINSDLSECSSLFRSPRPSEFPTFCQETTFGSTLSLLTELTNKSSQPRKRCTSEILTPTSSTYRRSSVSSVSSPQETRPMPEITCYGIERVIEHLKENSVHGDCTATAYEPNVDLFNCSDNSYMTTNSYTTINTSCTSTGSNLNNTLINATRPKRGVQRVSYKESPKRKLRTEKKTGKKGKKKIQTAVSSGKDDERKHN